MDEALPANWASIDLDQTRNGAMCNIVETLCVNSRKPIGDAMSDQTTAKSSNASPSAALTALLSSLFHDAELLLTQELALFRAEVSEQVTLMFRGTVAIFVGLAVVLSGGLAIFAATILLVALIMPFWAASLIVGFILIVIGALTITFGRHRLAKADLVPRRTWQAIRESRDWLREELL